MKKKKLFLVVMAICIALFFYFRLYLSDFKVKNVSDLEIKYLKITVCNKTFISEKIKPGKELVFRYRVKTDSDYDVEVTFSDNHKIEKKVGYVTGGMTCHDSILIDTNAITLTTESRY